MSKKIVEQFVEETELAVSNAVAESEEVVLEVGQSKGVKKASKFWRMLGPGLTTGAADDDPAGVATYSQTGAQYGFQLLWLSVITFPMMAVVQEMCARIGLVTGRGLAANIREHFPRSVIIGCSILLFAANSFNIGANLGAMAKSIQLVLPSASFLLVLIVLVAASLLLQVFTAYERYARYLKWLAFVLLSYIISTLLIKDINWAEVLRGAVTPSMEWNRESLLLIAAILGTTISPYLFFWQTSQEVEENRGTHQLASPRELKQMRVDVWSGMFLSNLVMFFIIAACGATLFKNGITNIATVEEAALALRPFAGEASTYLFALGIVGTGMLAIPVLAGSASYALSESFGWKEGLNRKLNEARAFYGVIVVSMLLGLSLNFIGLDPVKTLIYSSIANAVIAPAILYLIIKIAGSRQIMGDRVNSPMVQIWGWVIVLLMLAASLYSMVALFF